jgi:succinate dehydrogenase/fumarate reductase flavoprotein subunit
MNSGLNANTITIDDIDVLVIGGGVSATFAAIKAKEAGARRVVQVDKGAVGKTGNSCFAAGVIHVTFPKEDSLDDRLRRLTRSVGFLAQQDLIQDHLQDSYPILEDMRNYGVRFVMNPDGTYRRLAGRGAYPIVSFYSTQFMDALRIKAQVIGVEQINRVYMTELVTRNDEVIGAVGFQQHTGEFYSFRAKATVLATGGTYYKGIHPGQRDCSADGFGMAYRIGTTLCGGEHNDLPANAMPARVDVGPGMNKWMGEGSYFLNSNGVRFMESFSPKLKERSGLPQIIASFCIETRMGRAPIVMDARHLGAESMDRLYSMLPLPSRQFESIGIIKDRRFQKTVEWSPTGPVSRPGVVVSRNYASRIPRLFAAGESCSPSAVLTGLSAAATSGARAGAAAAQYSRESSDISQANGEVAKHRQQAFEPLSRAAGLEFDQVLLKLQEAVIPYDVLLMREGSRMERALKQVEAIRDQDLPRVGAYDLHYLRLCHELGNMVLAAELHLKAAIRRTETRNILREDYPCTDNVNWLKWIMVRKDEGEQHWWTEDIPIEKYPIAPTREVKLAHLWRAPRDLGMVNIENGRIRWESR